MLRFCIIRGVMMFFPSSLVAREDMSRKKKYFSFNGEKYF